MADTETGTKLSILYIVEVLRKESSPEHPLSQQQIMKAVEEEYGMKMNRKSVHRNLERLRDAGFPVACRDVPRVIQGKSSPLSLDWYWTESFTPSDLNRLIDLVYFSHMPYPQVLQLVEKIRTIPSLPFEDLKENVRNLPEDSPFSRYQDVLETISGAISQKKKITFYHDHFGVDGKIHHDEGKDGKEKLYTVSPYMIVASDYRFGLLFNEDGREDIYYFSLDLISNVTVLDEDARLQTKLREQEGSVRPADYLWSFRKLIFGESEHCTFEATLKMVTAITLDFGERAQIIKASEDRVSVAVDVPPAVLLHWALFYGPDVKITSPAPLVKRIRDEAGALAHLYGG